MSQAEYQAGFMDPNVEWLMYYNFNQTTSNYYASIPSFYYLAKAAYNVDETGKADPADIEYLDTALEGDYFEEPLYGYSTVRWTKRFRDSFEDNQQGQYGPPAGLLLHRGEVHGRPHRPHDLLARLRVRVRYLLLEQVSR